MHVCRTRTSLGRAARTAYHGTTGETKQLLAGCEGVDAALCACLAIEDEGAVRFVAALVLNLSDEAPWVERMGERVRAQLEMLQTNAVDAQTRDLAHDALENMAALPRREARGLDAAATRLDSGLHVTSQQRSGTGREGVVPSAGEPYDEDDFDLDEDYEDDADYEVDEGGGVAAAASNTPPRSAALPPPPQGGPPARRAPRRAPKLHPQPPPPPQPQSPQPQLPSPPTPPQGALPALRTPRRAPKLQPAPPPPTTTTLPPLPRAQPPHLRLPAAPPPAKAVVPPPQQPQQPQRPQQPQQPQRPQQQQPKAPPPQPPKAPRQPPKPQSTALALRAATTAAVPQPAPPGPSDTPPMKLLRREAELLRREVEQPRLSTTERLLHRAASGRPLWGNGREPCRASAAASGPASLPLDKLPPAVAAAMRLASTLREPDGSPRAGLSPQERERLEAQEKLQVWRHRRRPNPNPTLTLTLTLIRCGGRRRRRCARAWRRRRRATRRAAHAGARARSVGSRTSGGSGRGGRHSARSTLGRWRTSARRSARRRTRPGRGRRDTVWKARPSKARPEWNRAGYTSARGCPG